MHQNVERSHTREDEPGPRVTLAQGLLAKISEQVTRCFEDHEGVVEAGGMLVGEMVNVGGSPVFEIHDFINAGPKAECSPHSILFDEDYQSRELSRLRLESPHLSNIGCIHVHPDGQNMCSERDGRADAEAVRASDTKALVFGIITLGSGGAGPLSLFHQNFKFDFFVLTECAGYNYRRVRATVEDAAAFPAAEQANASGVLTAAAGHFFLPKLLNDKRRLVAEVRAMEERYGGRAILRLSENRLYWEYTVVENDRRFPIQVLYPRDYPLHPPRVFSVLTLPLSPHQIRDNELCWTDPLGPGSWNSAQDTAVVSIHAAHRWFSCLLVFLTLGEWPEGADHELWPD